MDKIVYFPCMRKSIGPVYKEVIRAVTANFNNIQHMKCNDTITSNTYCIIIIVHIQELDA
jgi:hypothetical protein